ncbi:MAG: hypothetical protein RI958_1201 [Actinomycetota bacterium]|jgi:LysM repeat protein
MRSTHRLTRLAAALATGIIVPSVVAPVAGIGGTVLAAPTADTYTVAAGDNLYSLARRMGVSLDALLTTNGLTLGSLILPGRVLTVPAGGTVPSAPAPAPAASPIARPVATTATATAIGGAAPASTYTIKAGDYFYGIARRHGVSLDALLSANNLTPSSVVHPGSTITIPAGGRVPATSPSPAAAPAPQSTVPAASAGTPSSTYVVQRGDGFFGIAMRHGVSLTALLTTNNLTIHSIVHPGSTLTIPAGGRAVTTAAAVPAPPAMAAPAANTATSPASAGAAPAAQANSTKADAVVAFAWAQLGKPYQFAAAGPDAFDCSGLTTAAYRQVGVWLPQQSGMQSTRGTAVDWTSEEIRPGDLVFTIRSGTSSIGHVGIAISATQWIHAPRAGDVVKLGALPSDARIAAVRRFV